MVIDRRRRSALLFNDRFGMNRVYVHECADGIYLPPKPRRSSPSVPELRTIDAPGSWRIDHARLRGGEPRRCSKACRLLPGASAWTFQGARLCRKATYFDPSEWESQPTLGSEDFYQRTREVFSRTLPRYFAGRERVGVSLTGGLDSRMAMAWQPCAPGVLPSYTWGGPYRDCRDVIVAREVARTCGQPHDVITMGKEFLAGFASHADRAVPDRRLCGYRPGPRRLHEPGGAEDRAGPYDGTVRRRGACAASGCSSIRCRRPTVPPALIGEFERARQTYQGLLEGHPLSFAVFRQAPWHRARLTLEETQVTMRSPFLDNEFVRTVFQAPRSVTTSNDVSIRLIEDGNPALGFIPTDRRQGVNESLPARLAHAFQEFTFKAESPTTTACRSGSRVSTRAVAAAVRSPVPRPAQAAAFPALVSP